MKKANQLIDWSEMPIGVSVIDAQTNLVGELLEFQSPMACVFHKGVCEVSYLNVGRLILSPADQQPWLLYEEGVTVIPDWAKVDQIGLRIIPEYSSKGVDVFEFSWFGITHIIKYRIIGIKEGYTDNPNEVIL